MASPQPVLLFNSVQHISVAIARSLHRRGIPVTIADVSGCARLPASRAIRNTVRLPSSRDEPNGFLSALTQLIRSGGYDMLLPSSDPGLVAASEHYDVLRSLLHVGCPPPETVQKVLDKRLTMAIAAECRIRTPKTCIVTKECGLRDACRELRFPLIAKPLSKADETAHKFKLRYFEDFEKLENAFASDPEFGATYLLQEFCPGVGVGIETLFHKGNPLALFQHRRVRELPPTGGGSVVCVAEPVDAALRDQAIELLRAMEWEGVAMVEFRHDRNSGSSVLMEVNGRYWGALPLAIHAGVDFPWYEWQVAHGEPVHPPFSYRAPLRCRWLVGDLRRLHAALTEARDDGFPRRSRLSEAAAFLRDFFVPSRPAMWSWSDPQAAVHEVRSALGAVWKRVKQRVNRPVSLYRYLGFRTSCVLLRLRFLAAMGWRRAGARLKPTAIRSVLFVCEGNLMRSPMAEAFLRDHLLQTPAKQPIFVSSAGFSACPTRQGDSRAIQVAREFGLALADRSPRRLIAQEISNADIVLVMDWINQAKMLMRYPHAAKKTFFLGEFRDTPWAGEDVEISDPFEGSLEDVRECFRKIDNHVRCLARMLATGPEPATQAAPPSVLIAGRSS